jgi:hypothetical protein
MNQELIEQLMDECTEYWTDKGDIYFDKKKFAALVAEAAVAAEREKVEDLLKEYDMVNSAFANDFRARGETK